MPWMPLMVIEMVMVIAGTYYGLSIETM